LAEKHTVCELNVAVPYLRLRALDYIFVEGYFREILALLLPRILEKLFKLKP